MNQDEQSAEKEPAGAMISIIIVVLVMLVGAYYFSKQIPLTTPPPVVSEEVDPMVAALSSQGTSDEIADIQRDIDATPDLSLIGADLANVQL